MRVGLRSVGGWTVEGNEGWESRGQGCAQSGAWSLEVEVGLRGDNQSKMSLVKFIFLIFTN